MTGMGTDVLKVRIDAIRQAAVDIALMDLVPANGEPLPRWEAGAHVDVHLASGKKRQYSLCGSPDDRDRYRIAILRDQNGRGGSVEIHDNLRPGHGITIGAPRNAFPLISASHYLFLAAGIGITPILPMAYRAAAAGLRYRIVYAGRSRARMAFLDDPLLRDGRKTHVFASEESRRADLRSIIAESEPGTAVYCCGPTRFIDAVQEAIRRDRPDLSLHLERFAPLTVNAGTVTNTRFVVVLARSGRELVVPADRTLGEVLREADASITFGCEEGYCSACITRVLAGIPEHRDMLLSDEERCENDRMVVCVGRSGSPRLVLDI